MKHPGVQNPCYVTIVSEHGDTLFKGIVPLLRLGSMIRDLHAYKEEQAKARKARQQAARERKRVREQQIGVKRILPDDPRMQEL